MKPTTVIVPLVLAALWTTTVHADIYAEWTQPYPVDNPTLFRFDYEVTSLADYDQVRLGLPNCGRNYCVPTASINMSAYAANHGFPSIVPGPGPKSGIEITNALVDFGARMGTDPNNGTSRGSWWVAMGGGWCPPFCFPIFPRDVFTITAQFDTDDYTPRMYAAAKTAIFSQGLMSLCHGWYKPLGGFICDGEPVLYRDGGHCLTVQKVDGWWNSELYNYSAEVWLRDPATDEGGSPGDTCDRVDPINDSAPSVTANSLELHSFSTFPPPLCFGHQRLDRLTVSPTETSYRLVDGYLLVSTKAAYAFRDDLATLLVIKPLRLAGSNGPPLDPIDLGVFDDVGDAVITPDMNAFVIIADNGLHIVDPLARSVEPIDPTDVDIPDPRSVVFGRRRGLYVVDGTDVVCVNMDRTPPTEVVRNHPPDPCTIVRYHEWTDQVMLLAPTTRSLLLYPWHLDAVPTIMSIPADVPLDGDVCMSVDPRTGEVWVSNPASPYIYRLMADQDGNLVSTAFALPETTAMPEAVDMDDAGHLFVSLAGEMHEFMLADDELVPVPDSMFTGQPAGRIMRVTRSSTNYDEAIHGTEAWRDVLPEDVLPDQPDCLADVAPDPGDGVVDVDDLLAVVGNWGPCGASCVGDVNLDGQVDITDLLAVLANWGDCPEFMIAYRGNACETARFVGEGLVSFDTTQATTDGPDLPVECDDGMGLEFENDIWLYYIPSSAGLATITTCGDADFDTRLAVYTGACDGLELRACNDDDQDCGDGTSKIVHTVDPGTPLFIRIGGSGDVAGTGTVTIGLAP